MNLYPAIDIMDGQVVRLKRGKAEDRIGYHADPVAQAAVFAEDGATHLHVVDLDAAFRKGHNRDIIRRIIAESGLKVQTGGGLRSQEQIAETFAAGVWRVVIGSAAVEDPDLVAAAVRDHGDAVCVGLDAQDGKVRIKGWTESTALTTADVGRKMHDLGVQTLIYTDIGRDGMLGDPDSDGAVELAQQTGCTVVVSGGVSALEHVRAIAAHPRQSCIDGVIVGRALYEGCFTVKQALAALKEGGAC